MLRRFNMAKENVNENVLGKALMDLNLVLTNRMEGFDFESKHKEVAVDLEFKILHLLANYGRLTPNELIAKLFIAKSNLSNQCKEMMKKGLITQFSGKNDKRIVCYEICETGRAMYNTRLEKVVEYFNVVVDEKDRERVTELMTELDKLID